MTNRFEEKHIIMSKTIYYLGAGASFGKRDSSGNILEGLPVVSEIPSRFDAFRDWIAKAEIPSGGVVFLNLYRTQASDVEKEKRFMLDDIDSLKDNIREHATIDTYARKLYLTGDNRSFLKLKDVLCAFFIWEQLEHKPDNRYDTFLANVLEMGTLSLPKEISIISWNYDSQIEMSYQAYNKNHPLPVFEKNIQKEWPSLPTGGRVFKVNGSATFAEKTIIPAILADTKTSRAIQLIQFYSSTRSDTSQLGFQFRTHLSFAWENSKNQQNMIESISSTVHDTEQVVVIGYSFPFFNREYDRAIFERMVNLKKIYVQDIRPEAVVQSLAAVLPAGNQIRVIPVSDCTQFYLPEEL